MRHYGMMLLAICTLALFSFCAGQTTPAWAAAKAGSRQAENAKVPPLREMGGQKIETEYFDVVIPTGWSMPAPVKNMPMGISALFGIMKGDLAVTINVMKVRLSAREMAEQTLANMRKGGLKTGELKEKNGFYWATMSGKANGIACFGSADGLASATVIIGNDAKRANALLEAIKPRVAGLLPASMD